MLTEEPRGGIWRCLLDTDRFDAVLANDGGIWSCSLDGDGFGNVLDNARRI